MPTCRATQVARRAQNLFTLVKFLRSQPYNHCIQRIEKFEKFREGRAAQSARRAQHLFTLVKFLKSQLYDHFIQFIRSFEKFDEGRAQVARRAHTCAISQKSVL